MKKSFLPTHWEIQVTLAEYMRSKYPKAWFKFDLADINLTIGEAVKLKQIIAARGWPDFFLPLRTEHYNGLFIEIKKSFNEVYTQKGILRNNEHLREQLQCLEYLESQGFKAVFGLGLDHCMIIVHDYLEDLK